MRAQVEMEIGEEIGVQCKTIHLILFFFNSYSVAYNTKTILKKMMPATCSKIS